MPVDPSVWLALAGLSSCAGLLGVICFRCSRRPTMSTWGRWLFLAMLTASGLGSLAAALQANVSLPYLGLAFAGLVIAMVWETPERRPSIHAARN